MTKSRAGQRAARERWRQTNRAARRHGDPTDDERRDLTNRETKEHEAREREAQRREALENSPQVEQLRLHIYLYGDASEEGREARERLKTLGLAADDASINEWMRARRRREATR